jgi:hypothetical protein
MRPVSAHRVAKTSHWISTDACCFTSAELDLPIAKTCLSTRKEAKPDNAVTNDHHGGKKSVACQTCFAADPWFVTFSTRLAQEQRHCDLLPMEK